MIGQRISPILTEIHDTLWEFEANYPGSPPRYSEEGFRAAIKILMSAVLDRMWELQQKENTDMSIRDKMAHKCGNDFRNLIKIYTNIDPPDLYK